MAESSRGPSQKMIKLSTWVESELMVGDQKQPAATPALAKSLTVKNTVASFHQNFTVKKSLKASNIHLMSEPFQVARVDEFLANPSPIEELVSEMEGMEWTRKQMDLYEFYQTTDLANVTSPALSSFYRFLNTEVVDWMQQLTGMKFMKISASCSMYNCGDFLLTHDDLLSDRMIAFVFYLSPWEGTKKWKKSMGGALELFETDEDGQPRFPVAEKIRPSNNQFVFFKVEKKSYHQVGEVRTKDYPRLTINGWFHGYQDNDDFDADAVKVKKPNISIFNPPIETPDRLKELIRKTYLKDSIKSSIQKQIEVNSETALGEFLIAEVHAEVSNDLQHKKLKWITKGPSNQQNYESLDTESVPENSKLKSLLALVASKVMFKLLYEYTELDLHGAKAKKPKCSVEVRRMKGGSYILLSDPSTYNDDTLDLILYFGSNENVGVITYLTPEDDATETSSEGEVEPVLLTIYPQNNFLNIVYRSSGTAKITKYCSKSTIMNSEFNYILFCSYKE